MARLLSRHLFSRNKGAADYSPPLQSYGSGKGAKILIVDDSRTQVHVMKLFLEQSGYRTLTAYDGQKGSELARSHGPDLILMDIVMPGVNGFQATRLIRKDPLTRDIPIIIVSGTDQSSDRVWGLRIGANDFLAKPFRKAELLAKIGTLLKRHRQETEPMEDPLFRRP